MNINQILIFLYLTIPSAAPPYYDSNAAYGDSNMNDLDAAYCAIVQNVQYVGVIVSEPI
jgi:hypothetical protein